MANSVSFFACLTQNYAAILLRTRKTCLAAKTEAEQSSINPCSTFSPYLYNGV